ncbi:hypothetical protein CK203_058279 [Vitis vinifera]|uniref:Retrotransposon gag domain-containing protein n=1 Tax=Vitis vinifera TaxID=29760 RepID=A0A438GNJ7_VITVI|nr:hypothetical protein CK203_058279 [Vitis vinifera]
MNFISYVAEFSREWDEPNARDMGRMTSQPKAKGEMYILNDGMDMKTKIAAMERRLEELEMNQMQEVQAISQTPLQAMSCAICQSFEHLVEKCLILPAAREMFGMPCAICLSYEHLVEECPIIPVAREIFGDYNTYNSNCRNHPNFFWEPQLCQYMQPALAPHQALKLEQAIVNLTKVVEDFVGAQKSINAQLSQRIDSVESSLNKRMDEVQNDLSQKIDNLQDSISRLINLNTMQEKENSPSQLIKIKRLEHKEESETEKEKREEIKGKKKGKSTEEDGYDVNVQGAPQKDSHQGRNDEESHPPPFPQALYGKIIQSKSQHRGSRKQRIQSSSGSRPPHLRGTWFTFYHEGLLRYMPAMWESLKSEVKEKFILLDHLQHENTWFMESLKNEVMVKTREKQGRKTKTQQFSHNNIPCANLLLCQFSKMHALGPFQNLSANFTKNANLVRTLCEFVFVTNFQNHALYLGKPQECEIRTSSLKAMFSSSNSKLLLHFSQTKDSSHGFFIRNPLPPGRGASKFQILLLKSSNFQA